MHELVSRELFERDTRGINEKLAELRGWEIVEISYPRLEVIFTDPRLPALRVRMIGDNWNEDPPSIHLLNKEGIYLDSTEIPSGPIGIFNSSAHPITGKPFICMRGSREYHTHSSHLNDPWSNLRGKSGYDLGGILTQIWNGWRMVK